MTQAMTVRDLLKVLDNIASFGLAELWDNVGLLLGNPAQKVSGVLVALDPTEPLLEEAIDREVNTIVTHHPLIFQPLKAVRTDKAIGSFLRKAIENDITVVGCHTNLDQVSGGVSDALASVLGLIDLQPLSLQSSLQTKEVFPTQDTVMNNLTSGTGFGRYGRFPEPMSSEDFLSLLFDTLGISVVAAAGRMPEQISAVAVCGGSGSDLAEAAHKKGAQVYITGEVKHSVARWAEACNFCVIDAGHFATENPVVEALVILLKEATAMEGWEVNILSTKTQRSPFLFYQQ